MKAVLESGMAECIECGETKALNDFSRIKDTGLPRPYCKPCNSERVRLSHDNVSKSFIERLWVYQGERCAVCGSTEAATKRAPDIDHDHACCGAGRSCGACVRGLVCSNCNAYGLAWYEALPTHLRTFDVLNDYIANPPAQRFRGKPPATEAE